MPSIPPNEPDAVINNTACSRVILVIPARPLFLTHKNGITPRTDRLKDDSAMGGVAELGNTSDRARSGTLGTFCPGVSAVETGVEFFTDNIPEAEPEKLSRIFTGVLPKEATLLDIVPLKVIKPGLQAVVQAAR